MAAKSAIQNYVVQVALFGAYPRGSVLPEYAVAAAGSVAEMEGRGIVAKTHDAVNVAVAVPPVAAETIGTAVAIKELDAERQRAEAAERERDAHAAHAADLARRHDSLKGSLADYVAEVDRLKAALIAEEKAHAATKQELSAAQELLAEPKPE